MVLESRRTCPYHPQDKSTKRVKRIPFRLLDCLGFTTPDGFFAVTVLFVVVCVLRLGRGGGSGAGLRTGDERKAVGEGIVIVSILRVS
jgi:hypothetical protein